MGEDRQAVEFGICSSIFLLVGQHRCPVLACRAGARACVCSFRETKKSRHFNVEQDFIVNVGCSAFGPLQKSSAGMLKLTAHVLGHVCENVIYVQ